jgi:hypothetical protein
METVLLLLLLEVVLLALSEMELLLESVKVPLKVSQELIVHGPLPEVQVLLTHSETELLLDSEMGQLHLLFCQVAFQSQLQAVDLLSHQETVALQASGLDQAVLSLVESEHQYIETVLQYLMLSQTYMCDYYLSLKTNSSNKHSLFLILTNFSCFSNMTSDLLTFK